MKIKVVAYPSTFEFETPLSFGKFKYGCSKRTQTLIDHLENNPKLNPTFHGHEDFLVEFITKTDSGEQWELGS
jgi:hypothetical protein